MVTLDLRAEVEIWLFRACAMHSAIIIRTVRSLWTWLWGRYHIPQNIFLVIIIIININIIIITVCQMDLCCMPQFMVNRYVFSVCVY